MKMNISAPSRRGTAVGLLPHRDKPEAMAAAAELIRLLTDAGCSVRIDPFAAARLGREDLAVPIASFADGLDIAIALGGDGALLRAARHLYPHQTPLFGVNFGHLGFLAEIEAGHVGETVKKLMAGDYWLEDRIMVSARRECGEEAVGLNDAVIAAGSRARLISFEIELNGVPVTAYRADGLIVATPTGSTAYSLSAGGPILHPGLNALVLTPVCAHALHARPLVISSEDKVTARVVAPREDVVLAADGRDALALRAGEAVTFSRAEAVTRLVRFRRHGFYRVLHERFMEGKI